MSEWLRIEFGNAGDLQKLMFTSYVDVEFLSEYLCCGSTFKFKHHPEFGPSADTLPSLPSTPQGGVVDEGLLDDP